jgi:hypothetical protein
MLHLTHAWWQHTWTCCRWGAGGAGSLVCCHLVSLASSAMRLYACLVAAYLNLLQVDLLSLCIKNYAA